MMCLLHRGASKVGLAVRAVFGGSKRVPIPPIGPSLAASVI
jgi:hypothetical protein